MQHKKPEINEFEPELQKKPKIESATITGKLPAYDPEVDYKLTYAELDFALKKILSGHEKVSCGITGLLSNNSARLPKFYEIFKSLQITLKPEEIKFILLFCNYDTKVIKKPIALEHAELVVLTRNAVFSPISFFVSSGGMDGKEYESPFIAYYQNVNNALEYDDSCSEDESDDESQEERMDSDFLQASHTLCHTLCLHVMKAIINDPITMTNIRNLNIDFEKCKRDDTPKGNQSDFIKKYRLTDKPLISETAEKKIIEIKQSWRRGNLLWSQSAFAKEKNIHAGKNQKLAHQAIKIKHGLFTQTKQPKTDFQKQFAQLEDYKNSKNQLK